MHVRSTSLAAVVAALALCVAVTATAGATRIRSSSTQIRHTWAEWTLSAGGSRVATCPITLEGSIHGSTIPKTARSLVAIINRAELGTCSLGTATLLPATLPWHITYNTFFGTLPLISALKFDLIGMAVQTTILGFNCLFQTSAAAPAQWTDNLAAGGGVTSVRWDEARRIPGSCGVEGTFSGSGSLTQSGTATAISITLI